MYTSERLEASSYPGFTLILPPRDDNSNLEMDGDDQRSTDFRSKLSTSKGAKGRIYVVPTDDDILRGRGGGVNSNSGKRRLLELIRPLGKVYVTLKRGEKGKLGQEIVDTVHGWGGRFLEMEKDSLGVKRYYEMTQTAAVKLVEQKFRDDPSKRKSKIPNNDSKKPSRASQTRIDEDDGDSALETELNGDDATSSGQSVESSPAEELAITESTSRLPMAATNAFETAVDSTRYSNLTPLPWNTSCQSALGLETGLVQEHNISLDMLSEEEVSCDKDSLIDLTTDSFCWDAFLPDALIESPEEGNQSCRHSTSRSFQLEAFLEALPPSDLLFDDNELEELYQSEVIECPEGRL